MERFYPDVDRTRFRAGWAFIILGGLGVAAMLWRLLAVGFNVTRLVLMAMAAGLAVWGRRLALKPDIVLEVDLAARTYVIVRQGRRAGAAPLDQLGPLTASERTRRLDSGSSVTSYVVKAAAHADFDLFAMRTPEAARRKMESLARAWRLPCRSMDGAVRAADELDRPLHERLRGARPADPAALRPEWNLRIDEMRPGYALVSSNRSWASLAEGSSLVLSLLFALGIGSVIALPAKIREVVPEMMGDTLGRVLLGLGVVIAAVMLFQVARAVGDGLLPGTVRVTPDGVSYRGKRLRFGEIEEVTGGAPIEILGDRRKIRLAASFCPPDARPAVAREIERMIVAVGPTAAR
jgi:hypothetical protein